MTTDRQAALDALRSARRRNRLAELDWFDAFYKAYVTAFVAGFGTYATAGLAGDSPVRGHVLSLVRQDGPAYAGLLVALAVAIGLRSGGRGGPLAFEQADVRHVLLAPIDRRVSLRQPAMRALRHAAFVGIAIGAAVGIVALRRFSGLPVAWIAWGAVFGLGVALMSYGVAMISSGRRVARWITDLLAVIGLVWAGADAYWHLSTSPFRWLGDVAFWALKFDPLGIAGLVLPVALAIGGLVAIPGCSIEAAERRSRLVGQLRFAATMQDIRTVMVIQRQLSQEHLRQRPWLRLPTPRQTGLAYAVRDLRGLLHWPLFRIVRLLVLAFVAGLSICGVWLGTTPLLLPAGLVLWIAGLDLLEPLAQEIDHPDRLRSIPRVSGQILARHLPVPLTVLFVLVVLGALPAIIFGNATVVGALITLIVPAVLLPLGGAALVVTRMPTVPSGQVQTPEIAGVHMMWQLVMPPAVAIIGVAPIAFAHNAWQHHHTTQAMFEAINIPVGTTLAVGTWCLLWVRYGGQMQESLGQMGAKAVGGPEAVKK